MAEITYINSIYNVHQALGLGKPKHPLISLFYFGKDQAKISDTNFKYALDLYQISIKGNCPFTISKYGRNSYDFQECSVLFTAPNQVLEFNTSYITDDDACWTLVFHPDLIRKSELGRQIEKFAFFSYKSNEALHLSEDERTTLTDITKKIEKEYQNTIDAHSQPLIISNLELLLQYCVRYYDRQFYTRTNLNQDLASDFEQLLQNYYKEGKQLVTGVPTVQFCAEAMKMSPRYLSDLLKKETGKTTQEHIHEYIIEKAKTILLNSKESVSEIAYGLGFEYPQYFSKIFKRKTDLSPNVYRQYFEN
ncbi:MAG: helix-turn-helix domain-containing protein [Flavobacteriales bacterium]